jgi:hypothetical protein
VIFGTRRHTPDGAISMPSFGDAYSDVEIAAVATYVTARFGCKAVAAHRAGRGGAKEANRAVRTLRRRLLSPGRLAVCAKRRDRCGPFQSDRL